MGHVSKPMCPKICLFTTMNLKFLVLCVAKKTLSEETMRWFLSQIGMMINLILVCDGIMFWLCLSHQLLRYRLCTNTMSSIAI